MNCNWCTFFKTISADLEQDKVKEFKINITSVVDFLISTLHSEQEPVNIYVPELVIVNVVDDIEYPLPSMVSVIEPSENVNVG